MRLAEEEPDWPQHEAAGDPKLAALLLTLAQSSIRVAVFRGSGCKRDTQTEARRRLDRPAGPPIGPAGAKAERGFGAYTMFVRRPGGCGRPRSSPVAVPAPGRAPGLRTDIVEPPASRAGGERVRARGGSYDRPGHGLQPIEHLDAAEAVSGEIGRGEDRGHPSAFRVKSAPPA
jgi:hypothetical protein